MTRQFSMGVWLPQFVYGTALANSYTDAQLLGFVDDWKNALADRLSLAHTDVASAYLYPAVVAIDMSLSGNFSTGTPAPVGMDFPSDTLLDGLRDRGIRPALYVGPTGPAWARMTAWTDGDHDDWLDRVGKRAREWANNANSTGLNRQGGDKDSNIIFRFAHEMNGNWFPWSMGKNTNTRKTWVAAWRYIHERLVTYNKAKNIRMFYCPHGIKGGSITNLYPGDDWTYYVGFDAYTEKYPHGANNPPAPIHSMRDTYQPHYTELIAMAPSKAILVGETSVAGGFGDTDRQSWIEGDDAFGGLAGGFQYVYDSMPKLRGINWFDINNYALDQGTGTGPQGAYAQAASDLSTPYTPAHHIRPAKTSQVSHPIGGTKNYGNGATAKITVGPNVSSTTGQTYKNRGLFGWSAAQMTNLLGSVPDFFEADLTLTVANEACATRGASPYFFLEELTDPFTTLQADKNGHALTDCQLQADPQHPRSVWPGPTATKVNRIFVDATGLTSGDEIVVDMTDIIQARIDNNDMSGLYLRAIACDSTGTTYDEANTARTITLHSVKSEGNEPFLTVRLSVEDSHAIAMTEGLGLADSMTIVGNSVFSVDGERGVIKFKQKNKENTAVLADVAEQDIFIHAAIEFQKKPKGGRIYYRLMARYIDSDNFYRFVLTVAPGGDLLLSIDKVVAGVSTTLISSDPALSIVPHQRYFVRFYANGATPTFLSGKVWAEGTIEPDPMLSVYDTAAALQTDGAIGVGARDGALTNLPLLVYLDEFWAAPI